MGAGDNFYVNRKALEMAELEGGGGGNRLRTSAMEGHELDTSAHAENARSSGNNMSLMNRRSMDMMMRSSNLSGISTEAAPINSMIIQMHHRQKFPVVVLGVVAVNIGIFLLTMFINNCPGTKGSSCSLRFMHRLSFQSLKENPLLGPSASTLLKMGALPQYLHTVWAHAKGWHAALRILRVLFSSMWLHAGVIHVALTTLALLSIGLRLELAFGFVKVASIYVTSGLAGTLLSALLHVQQRVNVGASGAVFGLLGAMAAEFMLNWRVYTHKTLHLSKLVFLCVLHLALGVMPFVDNFCHVGGAIAGFLLGSLLLARPQVPLASYYTPTTRLSLPPAQQLQLIIQQQQLALIQSATAGSGAAAAQPLKLATLRRRLVQKVARFVAFNLLLAYFAALSALLFTGVDLDLTSKCTFCRHFGCVSNSLWTCPLPAQKFI